MNQLEDEVKAIVSRITKAPLSSLNRNTNLRADLNVDSLQGLQIVAALEKRLGIIVPDDDIDMYTTVGSIVDTIQRIQPSTMVRVNGQSA